MPAAMAMVVMTIGRARFMPASMIASSRGLPSRIDSTANSTSMMAFLVTMPISIRIPIHTGVVSCLPVNEQGHDGAADRERQREQNGDRLQEGSEQQHQHRIDHHQAGGDGGGKARRQFVQAFGIAGGVHLHALRQALHDREVVDFLGGVAERRGADEVGRHGGLTLTVIAVDAGRALIELDVGDHR